MKMNSCYQAGGRDLFTGSCKISIDLVAKVAPMFSLLPRAEIQSHKIGFLRSNLKLDITFIFTQSFWKTISILQYSRS